LERMHGMVENLILPEEVQDDYSPTWPPPDSFILQGLASAWTTFTRQGNLSTAGNSWLFTDHDNHGPMSLLRFDIWTDPCVRPTTLELCSPICILSTWHPPGRWTCRTRYFIKISKETLGGDESLQFPVNLGVRLAEVDGTLLSARFASLRAVRQAFRASILATSKNKLVSRLLSPLLWDIQLRIMQRPNGPTRPFSFVLYGVWAMDPTKLVSWIETLPLLPAPETYLNIQDADLNDLDSM
jgi:hypothetical protein